MRTKNYCDAELVAASARERQRIAHDLHDGLGQLLGGIALKAQSLAESLDEAARPESAGAAELVRLLNDAIGQMRLLARGLDPHIAPAQPLGVVLSRLAAETERLFPGTRCTFTGDTAFTLPLPADTSSLYRVAQEAINNALRHGKARTIELGLAAAETALTLRIVDDGRGVAERSPPGSGIGLRIMKHRVESMGGVFVMKSGEPCGTVISCMIPNPPPRA